MELEKIHEYADEFMEVLRLRTNPLAIKMLEDERQIPEEAERPLKDQGYHLDLCQAFARSRWEGRTIAMLKEDMWCFEPVVGYGLAEAPEEFEEGKNRYPASAMTAEAGKIGARVFPRLEVGKYIGVASAPLNKCTFEPDLFVVYCDPAQLTQILIAKNAIDGKDVDCKMSGHDACVYAVVPILQQNQCMVASPCRGDRRNAMTQNNELIFSSPLSLLAKFIDAFAYLDKHDWGFPWPFELRPERKLDDTAKDIGKKLGIDCD